MTDWKKTTQREWDQTIEPSLKSGGFTRVQRDTVRAVFEDSLKNRDPGDKKSMILGTEPPKGITRDEVKAGLNKLRGDDPLWSKAAKVPKIEEDKLKKLESVLNDTVEKNKERWF